MKKISLILAIIMAFGLMACQPAINPNGQEGTPGQFAVRTLSTPVAKNVSLGSVTVNSSQSVLFILKNVGTYDIKDISITPMDKDGNAITDGTFKVTPGSITTLTSAASTSIDTLIRIDINHGIMYGMVGTSVYIDPSVLTTTFHITGKTSTDSSTFNIPVSIDADLSTLIKLADWKIQYSNDGTNWLDASYLPFAGIHAYGYMDTDGVTFRFATNAPYHRLMNTGNVPLNITTSDVSASGEVAVGGTIDLSPGVSGNGAGTYYVIISTNGTVFNANSPEHTEQSFIANTDKVKLLY